MITGCVSSVDVDFFFFFSFSELFDLKNFGVRKKNENEAETKAQYDFF